MHFSTPPTPVAKAAVFLKALVMLLLIHCSFLLPLWGLCLFIVCYGILCVLSSFVIILMRELVALLLLSFPYIL